jgi:hypothetical protein
MGRQGVLSMITLSVHHTKPRMEHQDLHIKEPCPRTIPHLPHTSISIAKLIMSYTELHDWSTIRPDSSDTWWSGESSEKPVVVRCVVDVEQVLAWSAEGDAQTALWDRWASLGGDGGLVYVVPLY